MYTCPGHCLCRTIRSESTRTWGDLLDANTLKSAFHEDTVTQNFVLNLHRQHGAQSKIHVFSKGAESKNGSDFLWIIFGPDASEHIRIAVQAKRQYPDGLYKAYDPNQAVKLRDYAQKYQAIPVYLFYNFMERAPFPYLWCYSYLRCRLSEELNIESSELYGLDLSRDLGLLLVPLDPNCAPEYVDIHYEAVVKGFPLWYPFCICRPPTNSPQLQRVAKKVRGADPGSLEQEVKDGDSAVQKTSESLEKWLRGESVKEGQLEELFKNTASDGFSPSFIIGTSLV